MSENQQATSLANWLAHEPGSPAPSDVDSEVMETIYALRPEYAPALRLTIDEVLDVIMDGPLLDPAIGDSLRTWLNSTPGTPPPKNLPIGIVEATYALRPDLAPALNFGIEDVLGEVRSGPLASTDVVDIQQARKARRWWASPALGAIAVAATALFFVGPLAHKAEHAAPVSPRITISPQAEAVSTRTEAIEVGFKKPPLPAETEPALDVKEETEALRIQPQPRSAAPPRPPSVAAEPAPQDVGTPLPPQARAAVATETILSVDDMEDAGAIAVTEPDAQASTAYEFQEASSEPQARRSRRSARKERSALFAAAEEAVEDVGGLDVEPPVAASAAQPNTPQAAARPLRLNPALAALEKQAEVAIGAGNFQQALNAIDTALALSERTRFDTARLWRTKARILAELGRETDAQHARETAAKLDPTR